MHAPLFDQLKNVRRTGPNKYIACCPAHEDSTASLSIRVEDDGTVLLYCFAGCATVDVVAALDLPFSDLFPASALEGHSRKSTKAPFNAYDALTALCLCLLEVAIYSDQLLKGIAISETGQQRLKIITNRFFAAHTYVHNQRY